MKKIVALLTESDSSEQVFSAARYIAKAGPCLIHGIFLVPVKHTSGQYPFFNDLSLAQTPVYDDQPAEEVDLQLLKDKIALMTKESAAAGITFQATLDKESSLEKIIGYSVFADLILVNADLDLNEFLIVPKSAHLKDLLIDAHCPVFVLNEYRTPVEKIILAYDGENPSSMYAFKMFSYLLPEWRDMRTILVAVNAAGNNQLEKETDLNDWLPQHFTNLQIQILQGVVNEKMVTFIQQQLENVTVVMGAYGRDAFSRLFHQSLASVVLKETKASLFITHE